MPKRRDIKLDEYNIGRYEYRELHNFCMQYDRKKKQLLRNKRSSRGEQDGNKKQEIIWLKKKSCKMTDFSLLPVIPPEVHRMVSPGRKWV